MKPYSIAAIAICCLSACGPSAPGQAEAQPAPSPASPASPASQISVDTISAARTAPVDEQFIECVDAKPNGITTRQFFIITGGAVKSYSKMQNYARDMCDPGQAGCALGWYGEKVGLYFETASGAINQILLDLDTLEMERVLTTASNAAEHSKLYCQRQPLPEGIVID